MKKIYIIITFLSILAIPLSAQQIYNSQINISSVEMEQKGDSVYIDMDMDISSVKLSKERFIILTPILISDEYQKTLPDVVINGKNRHRAYLRSEALKSEPDKQQPYAYAVLKAGDKKTNQLHYRQAIPFERWMGSAHLEIKGDACGCGKHSQPIASEQISSRLAPPYQMQPQLAYIKPKVEEVKARSEHREAFLEFRQGKSNILPDYMDNPKELVLIENMLKTVEKNKNLTVTQINITGFASPEGDIVFNERLAKQRAEEFKSYLLSKVDYSPAIYRVAYGGENWSGLEEEVETSSINEKNAILDIIKNTDDVKIRKNKLKTLNGGAPYRQMLTDIYPKLRKITTAVDYTVRAFDVEEAKEIIATHPQQLSLEEMFRIANTYDAGSDEFTDVFETAVRMYPDSKIANLNAAAAAISANNPANAEKYLSKSDTDSPEHANNTGVLLFLKGDLDSARIQFEKAAQKGSAEAQYNLQGLDKQIKDSTFTK